MDKNKGTLIGGETPDSGIDMNKFNIVDFILENSSGVWDQTPSAPGVINSEEQQQPNRMMQPLRTMSRQEFDRKRTIDESRREQQQAAAVQPPPQSTPVDLPPLSSSPQVPVPRELLQVTTRLENPTRYHLAKVVQNNISRFTLENSRSVPPPTAFNAEAMGVFNQHQLNNGHHQLGPTGSAPPNIFGPRSPLVSSVPLLPPSSVPHSSLGTSITSGCSELLGPMAELEVDSDLNMFTLSEINEMINSQEEVFPFPSSNITPDTPGSGHTPTPLQSPGTPEGNIIGMGGGKMSKDRQKKDNHNKIERRRRYLINDMINLQGLQLPKPNEPYYDKFGDVKQNKGAILQASVDYIQLLKDDNEAYRQKDGTTQQKLQQAEQDKKKLLLRIQELEHLCSGSGVSIPEASLTWRPQQAERINSLINEPIAIKQEPELMEEGNLVSGACDPMLGPMDDLVVSLDDVGMELS